MALALAVLAAVAVAVDVTTEAHFDELVSSGSHHSLVEFYAPWCQSCSKFSAVLETAIAELRTLAPGEELQAFRVDGDSQDGLRSRFKVMEAPGLLFIPAGQRADADAARYDGPLEQAAVVEWTRSELRRVSKLPPAAAPSPLPNEQQPRPAAATSPSPSPSAANTDGRNGATKRGSTAAVRKHASALLAALRVAEPVGSARLNVQCNVDQSGSDVSFDEQRDAIDAQLLHLLARREEVLQGARAARDQGRGSTAGTSAPATTQPVPSASASAAVDAHGRGIPVAGEATDATTGAAAAGKTPADVVQQELRQELRQQLPGRPQEETRRTEPRLRGGATLADVQTLLFGTDEEVAAKHKEIDRNAAAMERDPSLKPEACPTPSPNAEAPRADKPPKRPSRAKAAAAASAKDGSSDEDLLSELDALLGSDEFIPPDLSELDSFFTDDPTPPSPSPSPSSSPKPKPKPSPSPSPSSLDAELEELLGGPTTQQQQQKPAKPPKTNSKPRAAAATGGGGGRSDSQRGDGGGRLGSRAHGGGGAKQPTASPVSSAAARKPKNLEDELDELLGPEGAADADLDLEALLASPDLFPNDKPAAKATPSDSGAGRGGGGSRQSGRATDKAATSRASKEATKGRAQNQKATRKDAQKAQRPAKPRQQSDDDDDWYED